MRAELSRFYPALAWSVLILVIVFFWLVIINPALSVRQHYTSALEETRFMQQKLSRQLEQPSVLLTEDETRQLADRFLFHGESKALMAAQMQSLVAKHLDDLGLTKMSAETTLVEQDKGFDQIQLRLQFQTDLKGLVAFLSRIESQQPLLLIDELSIVVNDDNTQSSSPQLEVQTMMTGFYQTEKTEKAS
ncbi:hypothetical protein MAMP_02548 [Methylophaga aminisulfidivorans MP]|uniref:General secretion pathway protein M n=2 Tax=Methylophaga TaxID=40222 RepID=F5SUW8_9GAMM|nr:MULTISPECIES: type II secretion system protein GspM [Methylophaga]EGL55554.1 hypothetical protein MAMP_02548 [Methylophaga aminisulfidivorans MP]GLP98846.1 hypothetical protein GCM10007891_07000 [Methylophaga thalassica]